MKGYAFDGADLPQPEIDPSIYQIAMGLEPETGGADVLDNDGNLQGPYTCPPQTGAHAVAQDGFILLAYPLNYQQPPKHLLTFL